MKKKSVKKKRNFSLKNEYFLSWKYIKESRNFIYSVLILFFVFALIGFYVSPSEELSKMIMDYIRELINKTDDLSQFGMIKFIFLNNIQSGFFGMIFGFLFGIFPLVLTIANGYVVGFVSSLAVEQGGFKTLWDLVPHGIFELPAIFISLGMGIKFGFSLLFNLLKHFFPKITFIELFLCFLLAIIFFPLILIVFIFLLILKIKFREFFFNLFGDLFGNSLRVFVLVVIPLLVIAAIIEGILIFL